jgi:hypothetical protein
MCEVDVKEDDDHATLPTCTELRAGARSQTSEESMLDGVPGDESG